MVLLETMIMCQSVVRPVRDCTAEINVKIQMEVTCNLQGFFSRPVPD